MPPGRGVGVGAAGSGVGVRVGGGVGSGVSVGRNVTSAVTTTPSGDMSGIGAAVPGQRMPRSTADKAMAARSRAGWKPVRTTGSHHHLRHPDHPGLVTVPRHAGDILYPKLLKGILDQAGLTVDEFRELL